MSQKYHEEISGDCAIPWECCGDLLADIEKLEKRFEKECEVVNELCRQREQLCEAAEKLVERYKNNKPIDECRCAELWEKLQQVLVKAKGKDEKPTKP